TCIAFLGHPARRFGLACKGKIGSIIEITEPNSPVEAAQQTPAYEHSRPPHCTLMLAARITLAHFFVSSAMSLPKSAGEPGSTLLPKSANCAFILGSARPALISRLSLSMTSAGVPFGTPTPYHPLVS